MKHHLLSTAFAVSVAATVSLAAQGLDVRTGEWQFNMGGMQGALPLEGVPANMRATIEAEMRKPQSYKGCVTADDVKSFNIGKMEESDDEECKVISSKVTRTTADVVRQCAGGMPRTETLRFEASNSQTLLATVSTKSTSGTMTMTITGKWLAAQCKED